MIDMLLKESENTLFAHDTLGDTLNGSLGANTLQTTSPGHPVPDAVIQSLLYLYTELLGPLAAKIARKIARANQLDMDHLDETNWKQLLDILAEKIDNPDKRAQFLDRATALKP